MSFIEIKNLSFSYLDDDERPVTVLKDVNLSVEKGEFLAILGRNGSGKSTLAKLVNMIIEADSGSITVDGVRVSPEMSDDELLNVRRKVGMVFQNPDNQLVATVVEEDIAFGPENLGCEPTEIRRRVDEALEMVGMSEYREHAPHRLSGGQKQRIAIAGVIAMMPECIIFDEATAMLDPMGRADVMKTIEMLNREKGVTVIHITHNMNEAALADRIVVIDEGRVCLEGTPREVFSRVEELFSLGLEVPQVTELCYLLEKEGVKIPRDLLYDGETADAIMALLGGRQND